MPGIRKELIYPSKDVIRWLEFSGRYRMISVIYFDGAGPYSGAKTSLGDLNIAETGQRWDTRVYPRTLTVPFLYTKLQTL